MIYMDGFIIDISFKYPPLENCKKLLGVFKTKLEELKIEFKLNVS